MSLHETWGGSQRNDQLRLSKIKHECGGCREDKGESIYGRGKQQ